MSSLNDGLIRSEPLVAGGEAAGPDTRLAESRPHVAAAGAQRAAAPARKHSGWGIASFVWSVAAGAGELMLIGLIGALTVVNPKLVESPSLWLAALVLLYWAAFPACLIGVSLGIAGLLHKDRKKAFAVLGLVFSVAIALGMALLAYTGTQMPDAGAAYPAAALLGAGGPGM